MDSPDAAIDATTDAAGDVGADASVPTLTLRCVDAVTGDPVADAMIRVEREGTVIDTSTDEVGEFSVEETDAILSISAWKTGYALQAY